MSTPFSTKNFIMSKFYYIVALIKGVSPSLSLSLMSAPYSTKYYTTFILLNWIASIKDDPFLLLYAFISAPYSTKYYTTFNFPFLAAHIKAVFPYLVR
jgi:hypothetical protein